jgi:peptide/nickel transport system permease protein
VRLRGSLSPARGAALAILAAALALAVVGPIAWGDAAERVDVFALSQGASGAHPLGTDALGRDMLARTLVATRLSVALAVAVATIGFLAGIAMGLVPNLAGRRVRRLASSAIKVLIAFPSLLLALLIITIFGIGAWASIIALALAGAPQVARVTETLVANVTERDYVAAARLTGISTPRLVVRHVLPNVGAPLALQYANAIGASLLAFSALSFLGLGVQDPQYDWGSLLNAGLDRIYLSPATALGPAAAIVLVSLSFNVLGDTLADALAIDRVERRFAPRTRPAATAQHTGAREPAARQDDAIVHVEGLSVRFPAREGVVTPVRDISLTVRVGERVGIVGESGSGKSLTALAVAQLVEAPGEVRARAIRLDGSDLHAMHGRERDRRLATSLAMVFQDPLSSLNPALRVGRQVTEAAEVHLGASRAAATATAVERFRELGIAGAARRLGQYPHELSGGMRQRAVIAMGLMTEPRVIVADEPTTALDVTVQRQVLRALRQVNARHNAAVVLISHDISVVRAFCERVLVMYAGRVVEESTAMRLIDAAHPYTRALLAAVPDMTTDCDRPLAAIPGQPPSVAAVEPGCAFAPRCPLATDRCRAEQPPLTRVDERHRVACWHPVGVSLPRTELTA